MLRRLLVVFMLVASVTITFVPEAAAHNCQAASGCGSCVDGENHNHQSAGGTCQSSIPAPSLLLTLVAVAGAALVAFRRRGA